MDYCFDLGQAATQLNMSETVLVRLSQFFKRPSGAYDAHGFLSFKGDLQFDERDLQFFRQVRDRVLTGASLEEVRGELEAEPSQAAEDPESGTLPGSRFASVLKQKVSMQKEQSVNSTEFPDGLDFHASDFNEPPLPLATPQAPEVLGISLKPPRKPLRTSGRLVPPIFAQEAAPVTEELPEVIPVHQPPETDIAPEADIETDAALARVASQSFERYKHAPPSLTAPVQTLKKMVDGLKLHQLKVPAKGSKARADSVDSVSHAPKWYRPQPVGPLAGAPLKQEVFPSPPIDRQEGDFKTRLSQKWQRFETRAKDTVPQNAPKGLEKDLDRAWEHILKHAVGQAVPMNDGLRTAARQLKEQAMHSLEQDRAFRRRQNEQSPFAL
ncbi:MAG: hypothetical protein K2X01_08030 [Cyanobacteria bacterium]|nr:hypothetical protein [Cyanobacteriota bacterium]